MQDQQIKTIFNVVDFDLEDIRGKHRLRKALEPYSDYDEVKDHLKKLPKSK